MKFDSSLEVILNIEIQESRKILQFEYVKNEFNAVIMVTNKEILFLNKYSFSIEKSLHLTD